MPLDSARPTVLHVDDRDENRHLRRRLLEGAGFRVIEASTIREALVAAYQERPDVMLTDIGLPDGSGFEPAQQIKGNPLTAHIRVAQISAHFTEPEYRVRGLDSGADAYLIEPIEPAELVAVIRAIVRSRRTEDLLNVIIGQADARRRRRPGRPHRALQSRLRGPHRLRATRSSGGRSWRR